ncbi:hypothetical protein V1525DRAFT_285726 [Lipomyces kononenkoae]|uniref:Uncharacterized protein n=1 Tax=Lipomyces kononenkoae TaxID=34357 RepID=A0ACC3STZ4_LIPKO
MSSPIQQEKRATDFPIDGLPPVYRTLPYPDATALDVSRVLYFPLSMYPVRVGPNRPTGHESSGSNIFFGSLRDMAPWNLSAQLTAYLAMIPRSLTFFPIEADHTYYLDLEADVVRAAHVYLVHPVNVILQSIYPQLNICCKSEVRWLRGDSYSRLDMNWQFNGVIFAVLEFKRPYSIRYSEWRKPMTGAGQVTGNGQKIARQLKKYGLYARTPYVGVFDWFTLMLLKLGGRMTIWKKETGGVPPTTPAEYAWVDLDGAMRMALFCFVMEALQWKLSSS